jgi:hypothetical protein
MQGASSSVSIIGCELEQRDRPSYGTGSDRRRLTIIQSHRGDEAPLRSGGTSIAWISSQFEQFLLNCAMKPWGLNWDSSSDCRRDKGKDRISVVRLKSQKCDFHHTQSSIFRLGMTLIFEFIDER